MTASNRLTDDVLKASVRTGDGDARIVTLDPSFQGLPDTAHGGTVLALFDAVANVGDARAPRAIAGVYRRRVPLGTPLRLAVDYAADAVAFRLSDGAAILVDGTVVSSSRGDTAEGTVSPAAGRGSQADSAAGEKAQPSLPRTGGGAPRPAAGLTVPSAAPPRDGMPLPLSRSCFACGTDNALGLRVQLAIDDATVGGVWTPRDELRGGNRGLAPVALTALLDEAAFWLGAAASGESGMTTELRVRLHAPAPFGQVTVAGPRAGVRGRADDPRYWDTEVAAWDEAGTLVASAAITFVAVRGAARKLVAGLLSVNPPDVLRRVFPAYVR